MRVASSIPLLLIMHCAFSPLSFAEPELPKPEETLFKAIGVTDEKAVPLLDAIEEAEETEDIKKLKPFLRDSELPVVAVAAALAFQIDSEAARKAVLQLLQAGHGNREALLIALSYSYDVETMDYLVAELQRQTEKPEIILFVLRILTEEKYDSPAAWSNWWSGVRDEYEFSPPETIEEQMDRAVAVSNALKSERMKELFAGLKRGGQADPLLGKIGGLVQILSDRRERGEKLELGEDAEAGDGYFSASEWEPAIASYRQACEKDPRDFRSRFLLGCVLFEQGEFQKAAEEFAYISSRKSRASASRYLEMLSRYRISNPSDSVLKAALNVYRGFEPKPELTLIGWSDPVMETLQSQSMVGKGVFHISSERLDELALAHPGDPEVLVGSALLRKQVQQPLFLRSALEACPNSTLALAALISKLTESEKSHLEEIQSLLGRLVKEAPSNSLVPILQEYYRSYIPYEELRKGGKERAVLPAAEVALLNERLAKPQVDLYCGAAIAAKTRVLELTKHPFRLALTNDNMCFFPPLLNFAIRRIYPTAEEAFQNGETSEAIQICENMIRLAEAVRAQKGSLVVETSADGMLLTFGGRLEKYYRSVGQVEKADELKKTATDHREEKKKAMKNMDRLSLMLLPIPSLQNEMVSLSLKGEKAFLSGLDEPW